MDGAPHFLDELELRTDADVARILDVYVGELGMNQVCQGPGYALQYDHHDLPPIDWTRDDPRPLLRTLRARGLHITLAALPDCEPFWDGRAWDWARLETTLKPLYQSLHAEGLIGSVRVSWEVLASRAQYTQAAAWLRAIFPWPIEVLYHNPIVGNAAHLSPALSDEDEQASWRAFLAAGGSGLDLQSVSPYGTTEPRSPLETMLIDNLADMRCRALGVPNPAYPEKGVPWQTPLLTQRGTPMIVRNAEYAAYDVTHHGLPWSTAVAWGQAGRTVVGPGQDTALDGI